MKKITNIFYAIMLLIGVASCSKEAPFTGEEQIGEGRLLTKALSVELKTDEKLVRATPVPDVNDFSVAFLKADDGSQVGETYTYGSMPEVVTLPVGDYVVKAYYGGSYGSGNKAAFNSPFYFGQSERFSIEKDKIRDDIGTIVCKLSNVKVTIFFDESLAKVMSADSKVSVKVGESGSLDFTKDTDDSGFFAFDEGSTTLAAEFSGNVEGDPTVETKTYNNVQPGVHYRITFKLHSADSTDPGDINPGEEGNEIKIDAGIQLEDNTGGNGVDVIIPDDEIIMDDDRYPNEEDPEPGPGPDNPDDSKGPQITSEGKINLNDWNVDPDACVLKVHSDTGITEFNVEIKSDTLTPDELKTVGLASQLDLITGMDPDGNDLSGGLSSLGFPIKDKVLGQKDVTFDISGFMPMLKVLGAGDHTFILKVSDSEGENTTELKIRITE